MGPVDGADGGNFGVFRVVREALEHVASVFAGLGIGGFLFEGAIGTSFSFSACPFWHCNLEEYVVGWAVHRNDRSTGWVFWV